MTDPATYVDQEWQRVRDCLRNVSHLTQLAGAIDNPADAEPLIGLAMSQLMDAVFWNGRLLRDTTELPLEGIEP